MLTNITSFVKIIYSLKKFRTGLPKKFSIVGVKNVVIDKKKYFSLILSYPEFKYSKEGAFCPDLEKKCWKFITEL